jgi:DNA-binding SARP family transcriptional activator
VVSVLTASDLSAPAQLVEQFMYGLLLANSDGRVLYLNHKARQLLLPASAEATGRWSCCDLVCGRLGPVLDGGCLSQRALAGEGELPEVRFDIEQERHTAAAWVTVSTLGTDNPRVIFHLRPGRSGDRRRRIEQKWVGQMSSPERAELQISTLGGLAVEGENGPVNGEWLEQRPGQLFKYLICERRRVVTSDQVTEDLWPDAGLEEGRSRMRYNVHALREKLEPNRKRRSPARFVVARRGGYVFDTAGVWIDADVFEREAQAGLAAVRGTRHTQATEHLATALRLYKGDFLADDPYAEWVLEEQERLRSLAAQALRAQARIYIDFGRLEAAGDHIRRLTELEPFDGDAQQLLIEICLRRGRRSEAYRRYARFKQRMVSVFQTEPDFALSDVERRIAKGLKEGGSVPNGAGPTA